MTQRGLFNLETAVQGNKVMQDFKSESFVMVGDHSQLVKAPTITSEIASNYRLQLPFLG